MLVQLLPAVPEILSCVSPSGSPGDLWPKNAIWPDNLRTRSETQAGPAGFRELVWHHDTRPRAPSLIMMAEQVGVFVSLPDPANVHQLYHARPSSSDDEDTTGLGEIFYHLGVQDVAVQAAVPSTSLLVAGSPHAANDAKSLRDYIGTIPASKQFITPDLDVLGRTMPIRIPATREWAKLVQITVPGLGVLVVEMAEYTSLSLSCSYSIIGVLSREFEPVGVKTSRLSTIPPRYVKAFVLPPAPPPRITRSSVPQIKQGA